MERGRGKEGRREGKGEGEQYHAQLDKAKLLYVWQITDLPLTPQLLTPPRDPSPSSLAHPTSLIQLSQSTHLPQIHLPHLTSDYLIIPRLHTRIDWKARKSANNISQSCLDFFFYWYLLVLSFFSQAGRYTLTYLDHSFTCQFGCRLKRLGMWNSCPESSKLFHRSFWLVQSLYIHIHTLWRSLLLMCVTNLSARVKHLHNPLTPSCFWIANTAVCPCLGNQVCQAVWYSRQKKLIWVCRNFPSLHHYVYQTDWMTCLHHKHHSHGHRLHCLDDTNLIFSGPNKLENLPSSSVSTTVLAGWAYGAIKSAVSLESSSWLCLYMCSNSLF